MSLSLDAFKEHFQQVIDYRNNALRGGRYIVPVLTELGKCLAQIQPSASYYACLDDVKTQFCKELLASPEFHEKLATWHQLDPKTEQAPYLERCAAMMASLYAQASGITVSAGKVEHYHCDKEHASDAFVGYNTISHLRDMDVIGINLAMPDRQQNLILALQSVTHEQTHLFNLSLNTAFFYNAIDEEHPLYEEALYFRDEFRKGAYVSHSFGKFSSPQFNPYLLQLDERAAFRVGDGVFDTLQGALVHGPVPKRPPAAPVIPGESGPYMH